MATTTIVPVETLPIYPGVEVATALCDELITAVRAVARRRGQALPKEDDKLVIAVIEIDSLTVVEILCVLDEILAFEVGECAVRAGGYSSIKEAVDDVGRRVEREWKKHHNGGKS